MLLGIGATQIEFATGQDSYLNSDSQIAIDNREFQGHFGGETVILLFTADRVRTADVSDLFVGDNLATLKTINDDLADDRRGRVGRLAAHVADRSATALVRRRRVRSRPPTRCCAHRSATEAGAEARSADIAISLARHDAVPADQRDRQPGVERAADLRQRRLHASTTTARRSRRPTTERHIRLSLASTFPNQQTAVGGVILLGNASLDEQSAGTAAGARASSRTSEFDGFDLTVTGSPVYLKEINDYLQGGMLHARRWPRSS